MSPLKCNLDNTFNMLGLGLRKAGRIAEASVAFERAMAYEPASWEALANRAMLYLEHPSEANLQKAEELAQRANAMRPNTPEIIANMGFIAEKKGDLERALILYEEAFTLQLPSPTPQIEQNYRNLRQRLRSH
eukprot:664642-Prorocentrum_lima.AAC.1